MRNLEDDTFCLMERARYNNRIKNVKPIYKNTNELLATIFRDFDFKDKDVFSVMASSDQVFSAYYLGAKSVDTFDINWASEYFYYLKKWYLIHCKNAIFISMKTKLLSECLAEYDESSLIERNMYEVWKRLLFRNIWGISNLFLRGFDQFKINFPYENDIDTLISIIRDKTPEFREIDITSPYQSEKQYDIIILSNIMETIYISDLRNQVLCDNLKGLLKPGGIVINSIVNDTTEQLRCERKEFSRDFSYSITDTLGYNFNSGTETPLYYTYKKK